jgi:hypothetical protein
MGAANARASGYGQAGNMMMDVWAINKMSAKPPSTQPSTQSTQPSTSVKWNPYTQSYE